MDFRTMSQVPVLRAVFFAHLILTSWTLQHHWMPDSYLLYNSLFLISLLWSLHARESEDAIFMSAGLNIVAIVMDVIVIGMYYGTAGSFSSFMSIVNLLLRPVTTLVLLRFYNDRSGRESAINFPGLPGFGATAFGDRTAYEDLERNRTQISVPGHHSSAESPSDLLTK